MQFEEIRWKFGTEKRGKIMNGDYCGGSNEDGGGALAKNSTFYVESAGEVEREEGEVSGNIRCGNR